MSRSANAFAALTVILSLHLPSPVASGSIPRDTLSSLDRNRPTHISLSLQDQKLLWAINQKEASGRPFVRPRYEPAFYHRYIAWNIRFREAERRYGSRAVSSSYGPWQIMYSTAVELGYEGPPDHLNHASVSLPYVLRYLNQLRATFDGDMAKVISSYNAGPGGMGSNPAYTHEVLALLEKAPSSWQVFGT